MNEELTHSGRSAELVAGEPLSFVQYIWVWNVFQGRSTPSLHFKIGRWIELMHQHGRHDLMLNIFRDAGKSTLVGLFCGWYLTRWPDTRILVLSAEQELASKMTRNVRALIEKHPASRHLVPSRTDEWAADRLTVARALEQRDPSLVARGVAANITGLRADILICDDVEVPNTVASQLRRDELSGRLAELGFILVPGGKRIVIGTPHTYKSLYDPVMPEETDGTSGPFTGFDRLMLPAVDRTGRSRWPQRFSASIIAEKKRSGGPARFRSQMLLTPTSLEAARLDVDRLERYDADLEIRSANRVRAAFLDDQPLSAVSCWWDPSFGQAERSDGSVVALVYVGYDRQYYLHDLLYIEVPQDFNGDAARYQVDAVIDLLNRYKVPAISVEANGLGAFLPGILRERLHMRGVRATVREVASRKSKLSRILDVLDPLLAARSLHLHQRIWRTPFINEMAEWRPMKPLRDDGLDALSSAIAAQPVSLSSGSVWGSCGSPAELKANVDFRVL